MLLLTDGWDTGSDHGLVDAIEACQGADAMVYSIRYADPAFGLKISRLGGWGAHQLARAKLDLERITRETGGLAFEGESEKVPEIFDRIEADLRDEYVLGYTPPAARPGKSYHKISVKVTRPGVSVRARQAYYAQ